MKKKSLLTLLMALVLCVSLCACGGSDSSDSASPEITTESKEDSSDSKTSNITIESREEPSVVMLEIGDQIITDEYELTIQSVAFSYDVKPSDTSGSYYSYPAEAGQVLIDVRGSYKNISQRDHCVRDLPTPMVIYDTDYTYSGSALIDTGRSFDWVDSYVAATPLQTSKYCGMVDCPEEVKSGEGFVIVVFVVDGKTYQYNLK